MGKWATLDSLRKEEEDDQEELYAGGHDNRTGGGSGQAVLGPAGGGGGDRNNPFDNIIDRASYQAADSVGADVTTITLYSNGFSVNDGIYKLNIHTVFDDKIK
jgi:hypothetical protein